MAGRDIMVMVVVVGVLRAVQDVAALAPSGLPVLSGHGAGAADPAGQ
jgi:hypothetical protein